MLRASLLVCALAAAGASSASSDRAAFLADLGARVAGLDAAAATPADARQILSEASAAHVGRKAERLRGHVAAGDIGDVQVVTEYGTLVGLGGGNATVNQFLGVPFAAPPVGPLRWRPPQPPSQWGTRPATWFGPTCMQSEWYWGILTGLSEDCLYLNVYVPNKAPPAGGFPVMVFFYGGSYSFGGASFPLYDGETDVAIMKDVIIVATNYRLNAYGFLAGDLLKAESTDGSVGNYGFQDQVAALKFVAGNIAAFGGNPARVTIFGESAGGASVSNHLVSPISAGLFAGGIIESGSFSGWTAQPYNISKTRLPQLAANLGCSGAADVLACMRAVNETTLLAKQGGLTSGQLEWSPSIDGVVLPDDPRALVAAGKVANVPVMLGFNHDEGTLFNKAPTSINASGYLAALTQALGPALAAAVVAEYPVSGYEDTWWTICAVLRDSSMLCPGRDTAGWLTAPTRTPAQSVHVYFYTQVLEVIEIVDLFKPLRCFHASELVSVFDFSILLWGAGETDMAHAFVTYWTNFAVSGDPNGAGVPVWNAWVAGAGGDNIAQISTSAAGVNVTMINGLQEEQCAFWTTHQIPPYIFWG